MYKITSQIITVYLILFSVPKLLDIVLGDSATILELFLIFFLWAYTFIFIHKKLTKKEKSKADLFLIIIFLCLFWLFIVSLFFRNIPLSVIIYRIISYCSFYPFIYLFIYLKRKLRLVKELLVITILLCNITSLGIIYDFSGELVNLPWIGNRIVILEKAEGTVQYKTRGGQRRGSFFIGGSTAVYPFLSLGIMSSLTLFYLEKERDKYLWIVMINLFLSWLGCLCSLSRAPLILMSFMSFYCLLKLFVLSKISLVKRKIFFILLIISVILAIPIIQYQLQQQINAKSLLILQSGLSTKEKSNYRRYTTWRKGSLLFTDLDSWIGYGLGTSNLAVKRNRMLDRHQYRHHYESSIFSAFSEGGIVALFLLFIPLLIIIFSYKSNFHKDIFVIWSFILILNLFVAPIYSYSSQIAYFMVTSLCLLMKLNSQQLILQKTVVSIKQEDLNNLKKIINEQ